MTRLALPEWRGRPDDASRVIRDIDAWATSPIMAALVAASGASLGDVRYHHRIDELADISAVWDARAGRERDQAEVVPVTPELSRSVLEYAEAIGLAGRTAPVRDRYDAVLMTAGMVRAQVVKPRFLRELLDGGLDVSEVAFLGAFRPFSEEERTLGEALGSGATNEFDSMVDGIEHGFGPLGAPQVEGEGGRDPSGWREHSWQRGAMRLRVLAAPSSAPPRRANTADTLRFWATRRPASVRRVLALTTPIYVPYQATVAVDVLGRGAGLAVETVGATEASLDLGGLSQPFLAQHHLQELRSAILAMRELRAALSSGAGRA